MRPPVADRIPGLHVVHLADVTPEPWRNGGGATRELLAWPSSDSWTVRVSVARIDQDGAFSAFPGVTRWFTVLRGNGVELSWPDDADMPARVLVPEADGTRFDGSEVPYCRVLDGGIDALNVMFRIPHRGVVTGQIGCVEPGVVWSAPTGTAVVAAWRAMYTDVPCTLHVGDDVNRRSYEVRERSLVWTDLSSHVALCATPWRVAAASHPRAWWILNAMHAPSHVSSE